MQNPNFSEQQLQGMDGSQEEDMEGQVEEEQEGAEQNESENWGETHQNELC